TLVARTDFVGALIESGHSSAARLAATDHELQRCCIESRGPQICAGWRLVALLLPVRKGAMAFRATALLPNLQAGFYLIVVLRSGGRQVREQTDGHAKNDAAGTNTVSELHVSP